ncbi:MAG TPA: hypothetical protein VIU61_18950 [Kofleriaceae bacterium]
MIRRPGGEPDAPVRDLHRRRWGPGRRFIIHDVDARFGTDVARSLEIVGFDRARKRFVSRSFDDQGKSETFDVELSRKRWTIKGDSVRFAGGFDRSGNRLTGLWEQKIRGARWQPWIELELTRAG